MITQAQLDAGGHAVIKMATEAGFGAFITFDKARALAAAVLKADRDVTQAEAAAEVKESTILPSPSVTVSDKNIKSVLEHAGDWFKDVGSALVGKRK